MTIGFLETRYTVDEDDGTVNLLVGLISGNLTKDIVVRFYTEDGTATRKNKCHKFHIKVNNFSSMVKQDYR